MIEASLSLGLPLVAAKLAEAALARFGVKSTIAYAATGPNRAPRTPGSVQHLSRRRSHSPSSAGSAGPCPPHSRPTASTAMIPTSSTPRAECLRSNLTV